MHVLLLFFILLLPFHDALGAVREYALDDDPNGTMLGPYLQIIEDGSQSLTLPEAVQAFDQESKFREWGSNANFGLSRSAYWIRFALVNSRDQPLDVVIESSFPITDSARLHDSATLIGVAGDQESFRDRTIRSRQPAFLVRVQPGKTVYFLRVQTTGGSQAPLKVWSPANFHRHNLFQYCIISFFLGCFAFVGLYNFFLFINLRDRTYLYYVIFIFWNIMYQLSYFGLSQEVFFILGLQNPVPNEIMVASVDIILLSLFLFSQAFLKIEQSLPKLSWPLKILALMSFANLLNTLFVSVFWGNVFCLLTSCFNISAYFLAGFLLVRKGSKSAFWYTIAFASYLAGAGFTVINIAGLMPANILSYWGQITGGVVEGILLSLALADRFNEFRKQKYEAQKRLLALSAQKDHSYNQLAKVVYPHQIKSIEMGEELETTMPTQSGEGIVICFDIIGSSKLKHIRLKDFLEASIHSCLGLLQHNYDPTRMEANGYRIKELGDGFLCSIGYPFSAPPDTNSADLALAMAKGFVKKLEENAHAFQFDFPIYCGIGIAMGQLQGYYPKTSPKEYDIFGRGIVLATRYESIRKEIFGQTGQHSIILHTGIFNSLTFDQKKKFAKYRLDGDFKIRDDSEATEFYYQLIPYGQSGEKNQEAA
ncbi:MAG TPA: 7TM diverse intracellular signaling domain-containing protein [Oligoflexus sp.]|uniref:7TM diverse intracellular signaling domain-containing protein n=1 Tax=Oligoflexus sp. TaxID=1971216 RepID=UPI002D2F8868|nr:7TM diverse intracellular signaling domain-containing protein [Oligoflexus sp.]HYX36496.1 7TM diverse intracellular signaling domain-containing protein [Oligoflexus sp.]